LSGLRYALLIYGIVHATSDVTGIKLGRVFGHRSLGVVSRPFTDRLVLATFILDDVMFSLRHDVLLVGRKRLPARWVPVPNSGHVTVYEKKSASHLRESVSALPRSDHRHSHINLLTENFTLERCGRCK
jgi:hypothetical protein